MFSSFPKYRLRDNLISTNCMFFLIFLDFHPRLQQTAGLFSHFSCFSPSSPTTAGLFSHFSRFLPSAPNRYPTLFKIFSDSRPSRPYNRQQKSEKQTLHHPRAFIFRLFLIIPECLIIPEYLPSFQNISHHSRISLIIPEYLSSFQNVSHHSEMSLNFPAYPGCQILFIILAVRSYLLSAVSTKIL